MASITIRNLDEGVKSAIRVRAAEHGNSMEEEARLILTDAVRERPAKRKNLALATRERFKKFDGLIKWERPPQDPVRDPPSFR